MKGKCSEGLICCVKNQKKNKFGDSYGTVSFNISYIIYILHMIVSYEMI